MLRVLRPVVITTCVRYWDYLRATLPYTLRFASKVYVVTDDPNESIDDARVEILRTDAFRARGAIFNKSAALREAQTKIHDAHPDEWILLLDADIVVGEDIGHGVECKQTLYSVLRLDYKTPQDFALQRGSPYHTTGAGYFQLYFDKTKLYPESSEDASECDMEFYRGFTKHYTLGGAVGHLGEHTVNWKGRTSPAWPARAP